MSKEPDLDSVKVMANPQGRYTKVRLRNRTSGISRTISSIYLEPTGLLEENMIPAAATSADYIGGDINDAQTGF